LIADAQGVVQGFSQAERAATGFSGMQTRLASGALMTSDSYRDLLISIDAAIEESRGDILLTGQLIQQKERLVHEMHSLEESYTRAASGMRVGTRASNNAQFAVMSLARGMEDLRYGFYAVLNNIDPVIVGLQGLIRNAKSTKEVFLALGSVLKGPTGMFFMFTTFMTLIAMFSKRFGSMVSGVGRGVKNLKSSVNSIADEMLTLRETTYNIFEAPRDPKKLTQAIELVTEALRIQQTQAYYTRLENSKLGKLFIDQPYLRGFLTLILRKTPERTVLTAIMEQMEGFLATVEGGEGLFDKLNQLLSEWMTGERTGEKTIIAQIAKDLEDLDNQLRQYDAGARRIEELVFLRRQEELWLELLEDERITLTELEAEIVAINGLYGEERERLDRLIQRETIHLNILKERLRLRSQIGGVAVEPIEIGPKTIAEQSKTQIEAWVRSWTKSLKRGQNVLREVDVDLEQLIANAQIHASELAIFFADWGMQNRTILSDFSGAFAESFAQQVDQLIFEYNRLRDWEIDEIRADYQQQERMVKQRMEREIERIRDAVEEGLMLRSRALAEEATLRDEYDARFRAITEEQKEFEKRIARERLTVINQTYRLMVRATRDAVREMVKELAKLAILKLVKLISGPLGTILEAGFAYQEFRAQGASQLARYQAAGTQSLIPPGGGFGSSGLNLATNEFTNSIALQNSLMTDLVQQNAHATDQAALTLNRVQTAFDSIQYELADTRRLLVDRPNVDMSIPVNELNRSVLTLIQSAQQNTVSIRDAMLTVQRSQTESEVAQRHITDVKRLLVDRPNVDMSIPVNELNRSVLTLMQSAQQNTASIRDAMFAAYRSQAESQIAQRHIAETTRTLAMNQSTAGPSVEELNKSIATQNALLNELSKRGIKVSGTDYHDGETIVRTYDTRMKFTEAHT
jgi:hypothetical protein